MDVDTSMALIRHIVQKLLTKVVQPVRLVVLNNLLLPNNTNNVALERQ